MYQIVRQFPASNSAIASCAKASSLPSPIKNLCLKANFDVLYPSGCCDPAELAHLFYTV
ncbi:hypothetical protein [Nostoc sp. LPT]|uniref:hypothetical protein n=1 Tax=Nostoc sp. LPT TaxID=2815387 RepID=UPI001D237104|nr:hypothetical protein [Nostoc sp. LPT]MBN4005887.1 hypothetical protein [Nostoc sp. LPT]